MWRAGGVGGAGGVAREISKLYARSVERVEKID